MPQADHRAHDGGALRVVRQVEHEASVHLQHVDREALQVRQRGVAGPEIVQRHRHPRRVQLLQLRRDQADAAAQEHALGHLDHQALGREARLSQDRAHGPRQAAAPELRGGQVDRQAADREPGGLPGLRLRDRLAEDQLAHHRAQADLLRDRQELLRHDDAAGRVPPPRQHLEADQAPVRQPHLGLVERHQLAAPQAEPQLVLELAPPLDPPPHLGREEAVGARVPPPWPGRGRCPRS